MDWNYKFELEDTEDLEADFKDKNVNSGLIFVIDCHKSLFENYFDSTDDLNKCNTWFQAIIKSCLSVIKNKAMTTDKDNISVVFYRVNNEDNAIMTNVRIFQELGQPSLDDVKKIMMLESISLENFNHTYGFTDKSSLFHVLWCCQVLFSKCKTILGTKDILLFTPDDDPCLDNEEMKKNLIVKIRDLRQNDIHLEVIPVANSKFDVEKFYKMIVVSCSDDCTIDCIVNKNPISKLDELMTRIRHKHYKKRTTSRISWYLGNDNLSISVGVYNPVMKSSSLSYILLDRKSNMEVIKKRVQVLKENGQLLMPFDMKYCFKTSGKSICFDKEEVSKFRSILEPGMRLLGFKPLKYLKCYYQIRTAQFIYPDNSVIDGSTNLFTCLLKRCFERDLFALCVYVPRKSSPLQFVALVPQLEKLSSSGVPMQSSGFSVIFLPFKDDFRELDLPLCNDVEDGDREMSAELIKSLSVEYEPEAILNPALQKKLAYIEAIALDLEKPDKTNDNTVVDNDEINEHCGQILEKYRQHFQLS